MKPLYTQEEFDNAKSRQKLALQCLQCGKTFQRTKHRIQDALNPNKKDILCFCSLHCHKQFETPPIFIKCEQCEKTLKKTQYQINNTKHHFCSNSCACTYHNIHKKKGTRISKLEKWLAIKLPELYPNLEFHFNRKDAINSELDIYIPSLRLAFELNGIFHYEPIYGVEQLSKIQNNDHRKIIACYEKDIELCIIDSSKLKYFKEQNCIPYLDIIRNIISLKLSRIACNPTP